MPDRKLQGQANAETGNSAIENAPGTGYNEDVSIGRLQGDTAAAKWFISPVFRANGIAWIDFPAFLQLGKAAQR
jgi:hypothetical protein